eukprot:GHUV01042167.1.p2 GENE.GHUV01042167.1~~GHUV01042167.1.p2  ORF type:complete len:173 (+),score=47.48 GHUV01042167.1:1221-1739(+)
MSADSDPEELPDSDHKSRKGRGQRKQQQNAAQTRANALDPATLDPRRAKRILANRQSAQRSRMKRLQYIHDLENRSAATSATVKEIQAEVQRLQEQHTGLAEAVEQRKAQVRILEHLLCWCTMEQCSWHGTGACRLCARSRVASVNAHPASPLPGLSPDGRFEAPSSLATLS